MFGKNKNQSPAAALPPTPNVKPELWGEIYTMPGSYQNLPPKSGSGKKTLVVILVLLLVLIIGVGAFLFLRSRPSQEPVSEPTVPVVESTPQPTPTPITPQLITAAERDRARYRDIREIQAALELYFAESRQYPLAPLSMALGTSSSNVLSAAGFSGSAQGVVYLATVPQNPEPGGSAYLYESIDGSSYSLKFSLEEGTAGLNNGDHEATPLGIDEQAPIVEPPLTPRTATPPLPTADTDSDGLTDAEEAIFGSDNSKPDSDDDGYTDGSEVAGGYDPVAGAGALLGVNTKLASYTSDSFFYQLKYPAVWEVKNIDQAGSEIMISGGLEEFMGVLVVGNPNKLTAAEWYAQQFPSLRPGEVPIFTAGEFVWAMAPDGLTAYLATAKNIITFSYNIGTAERASYYQLFKAMIRLFTLSSSEVPIVNPVEADSNSNSAGTTE